MMASKVKRSRDWKQRKTRHWIYPVINMLQFYKIICKNTHNSTIITNATNTEERRGREGKRNGLRREYKKYKNPRARRAETTANERKRARMDAIPRFASLSFVSSTRRPRCGAVWRSTALVIEFHGSAIISESSRPTVGLTTRTW